MDRRKMANHVIQSVKEHKLDKAVLGEETTHEPMLHRAEKLINGQRQKDYGDKLPNFTQIAEFWNAHLMFKLAPGQRVTAEDVALMMINVKQARLAKSPDHEDSVLDVAGYAGCYDKILIERRIQNDALRDPFND